VSIYGRLFAQYRSVYFGLGAEDAAPAALGSVLPELKRVAAEAALLSH
jgi:L-ribulokinase